MDTSYKPDPKDWPTEEDLAKEINGVLLDAIKHGLRQKPGSYIGDIHKHCAPLCTDHERIDRHLGHLQMQGEVRQREDDIEHDWQYLLVSED